MAFQHRFEAAVCVYCGQQAVVCAFEQCWPFLDEEVSDAERRVPQA